MIQPAIDRAETDSIRDAPSIVLRGVGKVFNPHSRSGGSFKQSLLDLFAVRRAREPTVEALADIDLEVRPGEAVGVVGANGSGKSTLLKIVAGITTPTSGTVQTRGRALGVIELGAGFHPELSGEANVELQAAIYGLDVERSGELLNRVFDYAELNDFRRTPLKHYSSGMIVRLGFAIAVQCRPEILLVDEVLSVGDARFQRRCLEAIAGMRRSGASVLFVTHQMEHAERLCERLIWLKSGRVHRQGVALEVLAEFRRELMATQFAAPKGPPTREHVASLGYPARFGSGEALIEEFRIVDAEGGSRQCFRPGETIIFEVRYRIERPIEALDCWIVLDRDDGVNVAAWTASAAGLSPARPKRRGTHRLKLDRGPLGPGRYILTPALAPPGRNREPFDMHFRLHSLVIEGGAAAGPPIALHPIARSSPVNSSPDS
jgi:ABC-type polysaccharide/polyol phosphate transport system ATPase subunit